MCFLIMSEALQQAKLNFWRPLQVQFSVDMSQPAETESFAAALLTSPALG